MPMHIKDVSLYTVRDVANRLGIAEGTVRKYLRNGRLAGSKHAGAWHVTEESFRAFLLEQGDDLHAKDVPQLVIRMPVHFDDPGDMFDPDQEADAVLKEARMLDAEDDQIFPRPCPPGVDEVHWLIHEAKRLKERARRLEEQYAPHNHNGETA